MKTSIIQDDYDHDDIDIERNFTFIEEQWESNNGDKTEVNVTNSLIWSGDVEELHQKRVKLGKINEINRPVWLKEKQSGNELKRRSFVNTVKEKSGTNGKAKRTKNEKSYFELFTSENILKTIADFTIKTMKNIRNKNELTLH